MTDLFYKPTYNSLNVFLSPTTNTGNTTLVGLIQVNLISRGLSPVKLFVSTGAGGGAHEYRTPDECYVTIDDAFLDGFLTKPDQWGGSQHCLISAELDKTPGLVDYFTADKLTNYASYYIRGIDVLFHTIASNQSGEKQKITFSFVEALLKRGLGRRLLVWENPAREPVPFLREPANSFNEVFRLEDLTQRQWIAYRYA